MIADITSRHAGNINIVQADTATSWLIKPQNEVEQGGFPSAARTNNRYLLPRRSGETDLVKRCPSLLSRIGKAQLVTYNSYAVSMGE